MTELSIRPDEIRAAIERNVASYSPATARDEVGRVMETGDGIARVEGLHSAMTNELLEFEGGLLGLALNLDVREMLHCCAEHHASDPTESVDGDPGNAHGPPFPARHAST